MAQLLFELRASSPGSHPRQSGPPDQLSPGLSFPAQLVAWQHVSSCTSEPLPQHNTNKKHKKVKKENYIKKNKTFKRLAQYQDIVPDVL